MENFNNIIIRKAQKQDEEQLADLAYRAYYNRFFNQEVTDKYSASLRVYPELVPDEENNTGQCLDTFKEYWKKAMKNLDKPDNKFICYVAEVQTKRGKRIVGFRKGYALPLENEEYQRYEKENKIRKIINRRNDYRGITAYNDTRVIPLPAQDKIAGSSSLYIDPEFKRSGLGRRLIKSYAQEILELGFEGMMTSCYVKNDSQKFLRSMGGDYFIKCDIPVTYKKANQQNDICKIDGLMCLWTEESLRKLAAENPQSPRPIIQKSLAFQNVR